MSRQKQKKPSTALATVSTAPLGEKTITRAQANEMLKARALEKFHEDRARREAGIRDFEAEFGRSDRIDTTLLNDLQKLQVRLAAVAARQTRNGAGEPKVAKYVEQIGVLIGAISAHLATERAQELFARIDEHDYIGWQGKGVGPKGHDPALLEGYTIVDDPTGPANAEPTVDEDGDVCLHERITPFEDEPSVGTCESCGEEFPLRVQAEGSEGVEAA
jgi:hypothetical protein